MTDMRQESEAVKSASGNIKLQPQTESEKQAVKIEVKKQNKTVVKDSSKKKKETPKNKWFKLAKKYLMHKQAGRWFVGIVVVPWSLAATYYTGIASERYVSETSFMIEKNDGSGASMDGLSLFGVASQTGNDQRIVEAFINSPDMLCFLDEQIGIRQHYEQADMLSRLPADASYESFLAFYRGHMNIRFNDTNGMLELETQAFTPEFAQELANLVLQRSETFVNEIGHTLANEQLRFVQDEVELSEQRLKELTAQAGEFPE